MEVRARRFGICATMRRYLEECVVTLYSDGGHIHLARPNDIFPPPLIERSFEDGGAFLSVVALNGENLAIATQPAE